MNDNELFDEIKRLNKVEKIKQSVLADENFIEQPQYEELKRAYRSSKYHKKWEWHQIVRIVLEPPELKQYMYDRLLALLLKHKRSYEDYFTLRTEEGVFQVPNPLADLNKLEILYQKYFKIYKNIKNQIHFDYPKNEHIGGIRGKINWDKTIRISPTDFPMSFVTSVSKKIFDTPENILLVLCAEWMHRESNKLLQIEFDEPLTDCKRNLLHGISEKTKLILDHFPFHTVLNESKKFWHLSYNDPRIKELESDAKNRINQKLVRNQNYPKLLQWIEEFRELNIRRVSATTPTRHILESIENLDTVYEAWIFLEFVEYLDERNILVNFQLGDHPNCEFQYRNVTVTFWYEKTFTTRGSHAWAVEHRPDFVAMIDDEILCIFDAKNYGKSSSITDTQNKMLSYMNNLDANFGVLIYPNHPTYWDDLTKEQKIEKIKPVLEARYSQEVDNSIKKMAKEQANLAWSELSLDDQGIMPPHAYETMQYPKIGKKARFHFNQTLALLRMTPENTKFSIDIKKKTLDFIYNAIVKSIPMTIAQK
ncbi:MAG: hypothetical protein O3C48_08105 [Crenarchaeota archaeon]|nr:hypothetical protein [Thermoproteota archaeon]